MDSPHLDAFGDRELLGSGPSGAVFRAIRRDGEALAVKMLDGMSINRQLLEKACERLERGGWPEGVLEIVEADFRSRPAVRVTRCLADPGEDGTWIPRSLQHRLDDFPGDASWEVVIGLAAALAGMHDRQVAHGNLKPGNLFFDDEERVVLTDWALGRMPEIAHLDFTDACLYQPPEQLRSSDGYLAEDGYRWDVYAFGVIAYRLLTGNFPRCDKTFQQAAPVSGETTRDGIAADLMKIAASVEAQPGITWPGEPGNRLEEHYRETIERCLSIEPFARPANALEVRRMFAEADLAVQEEERRDAVLDQRRRAQKAAWRARLAAGALAAAVAVLCFLWQVTDSQLENQTTGRESDVARLSGQVRAAELGEEEAKLMASEARDTLRRERTTWLARVEESRLIGDKLFGWALEKGHRRLPPLDGRELRLVRLETYFERFLERVEQVPELTEERARARLQLAEISLAKGEPAKARERLEAAIASADDLEQGAGLQLRLGADRLILALLLQERNDPATGEAMKVARMALEAVPRSEVESDRVVQLLSILDIHESRELAAAGEEEEALNLLHRATENLNRLSDNRPELAVLRSELVSCYLSSATILDGMGEMGDARSVRVMAAETLVGLIRERPDDHGLRIELAGCYGAIAESSLIAGDLKAAEANSKAAVDLLVEVLPQRPDNAEARSRLAAQRGLMAGILRDRGEAEEAMELYEEGLRLLEGLAVGDDADPLAKYRFALLTWEKGKMIGFSGDKEREIEHQERAIRLLEELLDSDYGVSRGEQIRRSLGYVLGDLGHAAQLAEQPGLSASAFTRAVKVWEEMSRERPGNEEYEEALAWNRQRLRGVE